MTKKRQEDLLVTFGKYFVLKLNSNETDFTTRRDIKAPENENLANGENLRRVAILIFINGELKELRHGMTPIFSLYIRNPS